MTALGLAQFTVESLSSLRLRPVTPPLRAPPTAASERWAVLLLGRLAEGAAPVVSAVQACRAVSIRLEPMRPRPCAASLRGSAAVPAMRGRTGRPRRLAGFLPRQRLDPARQSSAYAAEPMRANAGRAPAPSALRISLAAVFCASGLVRLARSASAAHELAYAAVRARAVEGRRSLGLGPSGHIERIGRQARLLVPGNRVSVSPRRPGGAPADTWGISAKADSHSGRGARLSEAPHLDRLCREIETQRPAGVIFRTRSRPIPIAILYNALIAIV